MKRLDKFLSKIPGVLSSRVSIFIYLFLFFYLVIFAIVCTVVPAMSGQAPSSDIQLVLGNYTNVLSALGASIAAGTGVAIHQKTKELHQKHDELSSSVQELHRKIDRLQGLTAQESNRPEDKQ